jgi:hypothetical protein
MSVADPRSRRPGIPTQFVDRRAHQLDGVVIGEQPDDDPPGHRALLEPAPDTEQQLCAAACDAEPVNGRCQPRICAPLQDGELQPPARKCRCERFLWHALAASHAYNHRRRCSYICQVAVAGCENVSIRIL